MREACVSLCFQQQMFGLQTSSVTCQRMIAADYAMAWNEDIDAIGTYGLCHGSDAVGMVEFERDFLVAFRLPVWYFKQ